jgi:hypothetical protein
MFASGNFFLICFHPAEKFAVMKRKTYTEQYVIYGFSNLARKQLLVFLLVSNKQKRLNAFYINNKLISPAPGSLKHNLTTLVIQGIQCKTVTVPHYKAIGQFNHSPGPFIRTSCLFSS